MGEKLQKKLVKGAVYSWKRDVMPKWYGYSPDPKFDSLYSISDNCCRTNTIMPVPIHSSDQLLCCVNIWEEVGLQILLNKKQFSREILNISRPNSTLIRTATIKKYTVHFSFLGLKKHTILGAHQVNILCGKTMKRPVGTQLHYQYSSWIYNAHTVYFQFS